MPEVSNSGVRIAYDDLGSGEPALLFLSGWCANRTVFANLLQRCSRRRRCLTLDSTDQPIIPSATGPPKPLR